METAPQKVTSPSWSTSPKEVIGYHKAKQKKKKKTEQNIVSFYAKEKKNYLQRRETIRPETIPFDKTALYETASMKRRLMKWP